MESIKKTVEILYVNNKYCPKYKWQKKHCQTSRFSGRVCEKDVVTAQFVWMSPVIHGGRISVGCLYQHFHEQLM